MTAKTPFTYTKATLNSAYLTHTVKQKILSIDNGIVETLLNGK